MVETEMIEYRLNGPASQERQRIRVMAALRECRFPQAVLIEGAAGIGKKALALEIAKALQCTAPGMRPCGKCFGCKMAMDAGVTDNWVVPMESKESGARDAEEASSRSTAKTVQEFKREYIESMMQNPYRIDVFNAASLISVNLIRQLTGQFALKDDRVRVVIIAEADRMNESASNAFLKTLEEVPANTYFILTTSYKDRLLQTIRSRCLAIHLPPLSDDDVCKVVADMNGAGDAPSMFGDETADVPGDVIGLAMGSPGKAFYYMDRAAKWCTLASDFVVASLKNEYFEAFDMLENAELDDAAEANRFLEVLSFFISDILRKQFGAPVRLKDTTPGFDLEAFPRVDANALEGALAAVQETMSRIASRRVSVTVCLQSLAIRMFEGYK